MKPQSAIRHLLWDWNGTLLNDLDLCLSALNTLCERRSIPRVSLEEYRAKFTFPVIDYYKAVGFDFDTEPFERPAQEWVDMYTSRVRTESQLYTDAIQILARLRDDGYQQSVLSAYHHEMLVSVMKHFGVDRFFNSILGLGDFFAESKVELGRAWIANSGLDPATVLMIGDTLHDHEVAEAMGVRCVLASQGHQSKERLLQSGSPVLDSIDEIPGFLARYPG